MRPGIQKNDSDSSPGSSLDGSFGKLGSAAFTRSISSTSSKFIPTSKRVHKVLKEYAMKLVDLNIFTEYLEDWVRENVCGKTRDEEQCFSSPFLIDDLRTFDFALEGVLFQQLLRMPYPPYSSDNQKKMNILQWRILSILPQKDCGMHFGIKISLFHISYPVLVILDQSFIL